MTDEGRVQGVVLEVLREAIRTRGLAGLMLGSPPSPEGTLLQRWCRGATPLVALAPGDVTPVAAALGGDSDEAWMAAAQVRASREGLLPVHAANKLQLLLSPVPWAPCYPMGDLWPSELRPWAGGASLPPLLASWDSDAAAAAEAALRRGLDEGQGVRRVLTDWDVEPARTLLRSLAEGRARSQAPLVPKLGNWTLGVDPSP